MWWWSQRLEGCIYKHSCSHTCTVLSARWTLISSFNVEPCFLTLTACRHAGWGLASITDSLLAALVRATAASAPRPQPTALWEALATHPCPHISSGVSNTPRNMEKLRPVDKLRQWETRDEFVPLLHLTGLSWCTEVSQDPSRDIHMTKPLAVSY